MWYSLIHIPQIDRTAINEFRKKYDSYESIVDSHITIVFPVIDSDISKEKLVSHVRTIISGWKPFDIEISGIEKSWDNWMFLLLSEGNEKVIELHNELYTGILEKELRHDIEYIPHIGVGTFNKEGDYDLRDPTKTEFDEDRYYKALDEMKKLDIHEKSNVDKLSLIEIDEQFTQSTIVEEFLIE